jgi:hypothetical protein
MECKTVRLLLPYLLSRTPELDAGDAASLRSHLNECSECAAVARAEAQTDAWLAGAMRDVPVPAHLQGRILARLQRERTAWYRRRVLVPVAAAASLLLAVGLGLWLHVQPTTFDLEQFCVDAMQQNGAPAEQAERWFAERGVQVPLPRDFNYAMLASYDLVHFQGHDRVPRLDFERDQARLRVYVLTSQHFNIKAIVNQEPHASGGYTVQVWQHRERPDCAYLVLYTGGPLEWFLVAQPGVG